MYFAGNFHVFLGVGKSSASGLDQVTTTRRSARRATSALRAPLPAAATVRAEKVHALDVQESEKVLGSLGFYSY